MVDSCISFLLETCSSLGLGFFFPSIFDRKILLHSGKKQLPCVMVNGVWGRQQGVVGTVAKSEPGEQPQ